MTDLGAKDVFVQGSPIMNSLVECVPLSCRRRTEGCRTGITGSYAERAGMFFLLILIAGLANAQSATDLTERLHQGELATSLDLPTEKPWHLRMTFQLFGGNQQVSDSGSIEEWWAPGKHRISVASTAYNAVEVRNEQGVFRTASTEHVPYAIDELRATVVHPMPSDLAIKDSKLELRRTDFGKVPVDCVVLAQKIGAGLSDGNVFGATAGLGLFPTFCFDHAKDSLRMIADSGTETIVLSNLGRFLGRSVAVKLSIITAGKVTSEAHVEVLSSATEEQGHFEDVASLVPSNQEANVVEATVMKGKLISKAGVIYPDSAKAAHVSGTVILRAIIGEDGHIRKLQVKQVPSPDLAIAAIQAVRQWVYSPYILNGKPREVDTIITVNFRFGR